MGKQISFRRARLLWGRFEEAAGISSTPAFTRLYRAYGGRDRSYHDRRHVVDVVQRVTRMGRTLPNRTQTALLAAAWYHDVVYVTTRHDNEERSAGDLAKAMRRCGLDRRTIAVAVRLVLATKRHTPSDLAEKVLVDADLATLSSSPARYAEYAADIRREYGWVPEAAYRDGRAAVLSTFLSRPVIYHTRRMRRREAAARANIEREIGLLGSMHI